MERQNLADAFPLFVAKYKEKKEDGNLPQAIDDWTNGIPMALLNRSNYKHPKGTTS